MSNADLLVEAVDTAVRLFYAGAAWVVLTAAVATLALYAGAVIAWGICRWVWKAVRAACAPAGGLRGPLRLPRRLPTPPVPSGGRTAPRAPSWARTEPHRYDNAA